MIPRDNRRPTLVGGSHLVALALLTLGLTLHAPQKTAAQPGPNQMGSGTAFMDFDRDGDMDVFYLTTRDGRILVYRNELKETGSLGFTDVSDTAMPIGTSTANGMGLACGDVNNDGYDDLFATYGPSPGLNVNTPYRLFMNRGDGTFVETTRASGLNSYQSGTLSSSAAFFDFDRDGDLDLYVGNYVRMEAGPNGMPMMLNARNDFYENTGVNPATGNPIFIDVTEAKGVGWCGGSSEWTLGIAVGDYDNDGDSDLYVANDYGGFNADESIRDGDNALFRNNGDGTFTNVTIESNTRDGGYAMGVDFGDFDNDGFLDIYLANFWQDTLLRNRGDGTFEDVTASMGIVENLNGWAASFRDYDNDGDLDILNVNGWISNSWGQIECETNALWQNEGPLAPVQFVNRTVEAGFHEMGDARGAAWGDIDQDGWVDMAVLNNTDWEHSSETCGYNAPKRLLYMNQRDRTFHDVSGIVGLRPNTQELPHPEAQPLLSNHWLTIVPHGTVSNRSAIGTRVTIHVGDRTMIRELGCGSYMSANEPAISFGIGSATVIDDVIIRWPNGLVETMSQVPADQRLEVTEGQVGTPITLVSFTARSRDEGVDIAWVFADATDHAGFNIHRRSPESAGEVRLNAGLIRGDGGSLTFRDQDAPAGRIEYRLEAVSRTGVSSWYGPLIVDHAPPNPRLFVGQNYPNPFNPTTVIPYVAPAGEAREIVIYGTSGEVVRRLPTGPAAAGRGEVSWDGRDDSGRAVPSGLYYYRLNGQGLTRRMALLK